jgi:hypothetical protein
VVGNDGIFCKEISVGGATKAKYQMRKLEGLPMENHASNLDLIINFDGPTLTPKLDITHTYYGLEAENIRPLFKLIEKEKHIELAKDIFSVAKTQEDLSNFSFANAEFSDYNKNTPIILKATVNAKDLNGKAGNKYLFKIGEVIGRQSEMYKKDKPRQMPIEISHAHSYLRKITVNIPEGYIIKNLDDLKMNKDHGTYGFKSEYTLNGQKLEITVNEYYKNIYWPASEIDTYREVINAAADWNKITLVIEKK